MARNFNGTSDVLKTSVGTPMNVAFGTFAAIVNVTSFAATRSIMRLATTTPTNVLGFSLNTSGNLILTDGVSAPAGATALVAGEWYLIAAGKATGTTTPRYHIYRYSTDTWVHENAGGTVANATVPATTGRMNLMARAADQFTPGDMAVAGFWSRLLSDAEVEQLSFSLQGWYATAPTGLWVLDQGATTQNVPDLSGNGGNQASLTGTTVSTNSVPVFSYGSDVIKPYAIPPNVSNILFRALGTTSKVASGNMSPGLPAGVAQNDILILVTSQQDNVSCSVTGYTQVSAVNNSTNCRQEIWIKRAGASESAPTVTHTAGGVSNAVIAAYSGVDTGLTLSVGAGGVIRDLQTASSAAASPTCTGPALTGVVLYDELVFAGMFTVNDTSGATTNNWTTVSGMTEERDDCSSLAGSWGTSFAIDDVRATGSAGAVSSTIGYLGSLTTERNIGCQLALSSDVSGGAGTQTVSAAAASSSEATGASAVTTVTTVASGGAGSSEAAGPSAITTAITVSPSAAPSTETTGVSAVSVSVGLSPAGVASGESAGASGVSATATITPSGAAVSEKSAASSVAPGTVQVAPSAAGGSEGAGRSAITAAATIAASGTGSSENTAGSVVTPGAVSITPGAAATGESAGLSAAVTAPTQNVTPAGAPSLASAALSAVTTSVTIAASGSPSTERPAASVVMPGAVQLAPAAAPSSENAGTSGISAVPSQTITPSGAASQASTGASALSATTTIAPAGVGSGEGSGTGVVQPGAVTIQPAAAPTAERVAASLLTTTVILSPGPVVSEERVAPSAISQLTMILAAGAGSGGQVGVSIAVIDLIVARPGRLTLADRAVTSIVLTDASAAACTTSDVAFASMLISEGVEA